MKREITTIITLGLLVVIAGCPGGDEAVPTSGIRVLTDLSAEQVQPGGAIQLRASVNNYYSNVLQNPMIKIVRSFGELTVPNAEQSLGREILANPNATTRATWQVSVSRSASSGTEYTNRVRMCFKYTQRAWHEVAITNSYDIESIIRNGADTGPIRISFSGLDQPYVKGEDISAEIPISVGLRNVYTGRIGPIDLPGTATANLTEVRLKIFDSKSDGVSPETGTFSIIADYNSPTQTLSAIDSGNHFWCNSTGGSVTSYNAAGKFYECVIQNMSVFGSETYLNTRLEVNRLDDEEMIERIEVTATYDYCVESKDFKITVFAPGGR